MGESSLHKEQRGFVCVVDKRWEGALSNHPCQEILQDLVVILVGYAKIFQLFVTANQRCEMEAFVCGAKSPLLM